MRAKRSDAERQEWRDKMHGLAASVRQMSEEERQARAAELGTITCEGRPLSPFNCCFLWTQAGRPLLQVGGFKQWQRVGRQVRKGERAAGYIFVPTSKRGEAAAEFTAAAERGDEERTRFLMVPVFDVTQTEEGAGEAGNGFDLAQGGAA